MDNPRLRGTPEARRRRRIDRRRHEIMDAAVRIIAEHGYANTTTKAIADAADIAEGTLYNYFKSKRDILLGILQQLQQEADELLDEVESSEGTGDPVAIVEWALNLLLTRLPFKRVLFAESWTHDDLLRDYAAERVTVIYKKVKSFLVGQMKSGTFRSVHPDLATKMVLGVCLAPLVPAMRGVAEPPSPEELHAMAVADLSLDTESRRLVAGLESSSIFDAVTAVDSEAEVLRAIDEGTVYAGLVIPADLASAVDRGDAQVLIPVDGSHSFEVQSSYVAAASIAQAYGMELMMEKVQRMGMESMIGTPIVTSTRILYSPSMDSLNFSIPGLAAILLQLISVNVTAMSVVREREHGTMEQILATPTRPLELILGKMTSGILLVGIDLTIIIALGLYWSRVPFRGSIGLLICLSMIFIVSGLGLGWSQCGHN